VTVHIDIWCTKPGDEREYDTSEVGLSAAYFGDWFRKIADGRNGYQAAQDAPTSTLAYAILRQTYKGRDTDGIGLDWAVIQE